MTDTQQLLADYVATGSEAAFRDLVSRYVDLVHSAAVRLVNGDTHLAEDVTQTVFADLARLARTLSREVMLGGWLHRHTCFVASKTLRGERRRQERERQAVEMNALEDHSAANLASLAPVLDEAVNQLSAEDRAAILLRFFEQQDFRSVGESLGSNEEAARKRVDRALDKLHALLKVRGVTLSGTALAATLAAGSVTAAPAGFALSISTAALATAAAGTGTTLTILQIMSMTKLKAAVITAVVAAGITIPLLMQQQAKTQLTEVNEALQQQTQRSEELAAENARLAKLAAQPAPTPVATNNPSLELLRLRGEVARLRQEVSNERLRTNGPSALSGIKANPEMWKLIRDQQKVGMGSIYKDFAKKLNLPKEQSEKLTELLADNVMENIDHITAVLRDGMTPAQMEPIFAGQEAAMLEKISELLGPEALAQYQEYTKRLASNITAEQFKGMLTGEKAEQETKSRQLYDMMLEETQQILAGAGLPADYQTLPMLNFRNIASETEAEKNLKLMDSVYERVIVRADSFLSPEEVGKLEEFRSKAISAQRMALSLNRTMMAPSSK
jgi:RNA polymerase sigma factor (sigma-70 family)